MVGQIRRRILGDTWKFHVIQISVPINENCIGIQTHPLIYILSLPAFTLQQQSWLFVTEMVWSMKPTIFTDCFFIEKYYQPLLISYCSFGSRSYPSTCLIFRQLKVIICILYELFHPMKNREPQNYLPWRTSSLKMARSIKKVHIYRRNTVLGASGYYFHFY